MADRVAILPIIVPIGICQVSQMKAALTAADLFDAVEAGLGNLGPTDPATILWQTGGPMTLGGPLAVSIASSTNKSNDDMTELVASAAMIVL